MPKIGEGTYGCVYYPKLDCKSGCNKAICKSDIISKVLLAFEADKEEHNNRIIDRIDPDNLFHYGSTSRHMCEIDRDEIPDCDAITNETITSLVNTYNDWLAIFNNKKFSKNQLYVYLLNVDDIIKTDKTRSICMDYNLNKNTLNRSLLTKIFTELYTEITNYMKVMLIYYPYGGLTIKKYLKRLAIIYSYIQKNDIAEFQVFIKSNKQLASFKILKTLKLRLKTDKMDKIIKADWSELGIKYVTTEYLSLLINYITVIYGALRINQAGYSHNDIKLLNILTHDGKITLIDYGLLKSYQEVIDKNGWIKYNRPYNWGLLSYIASDNFTYEGIEEFLILYGNTSNYKDTILNTDYQIYLQTARSVYKQILRDIPDRQAQIRYFMNQSDYWAVIKSLFEISNALPSNLASMLHEFLRDKMYYEPWRNINLEQLLHEYINLVQSMMKYFIQKNEITLDIYTSIAENVIKICDEIGMPFTHQKYI